MEKKENINQTEQCPVNIGDAVFQIDVLRNKVTEYRVANIKCASVFLGVSGIGEDAYFHISIFNKILFMSRDEAEDYLKNNRQKLLDEYRQLFEKTGDWSKLAELGNILAEEKENARSGACVSAEEIEILVDMLESIKNRIVKADMDLIYYTDLYKEDLARIDSRTIERVIQILKDLC